MKLSDFWNPEKCNVTSTFWPLAWRLGQASGKDCPLLCETLRPNANKKGRAHPLTLGGKSEHNVREEVKSPISEQKNKVSFKINKNPNY